MKDKTKEMESFGLRVEQLIDERGVKRYEFDQATGTTTQLRYDWRRRGAVPNAVIVYKIAKYFGVTMEYLLTGETSSNPLDSTVKSLQDRIQKMKDFVKNA